MSLQEEEQTQGNTQGISTDETALNEAFKKEDSTISNARTELEEEEEANNKDGK